MRRNRLAPTADHLAGIGGWNPPWTRRAVTVGTASLVALGGFLLVALLAELLAPPAAPGPFPAGPLSIPAHHDFLAFWAAGSLVLRGAIGSIYDPAAIATLQRTVLPYPVGANGYMPFINPPFAALVLAPLGLLTEPAARVAWTLGNVAVLLVAAAWIARGLRGWRRIAGILLVAVAFVAYHALAEGQWSVLLLGAGLVALAAGRRGAWTTAGVALSPLIVKPQLFLLALLLLAAARRWRALLAASAAAAAIVLVTLPVTGADLDARYVGYLASVVTSHFNGAGAAGASAWQGDIRTMEGLNGLVVGLVGQGDVRLVDGLWAALAVGVAAVWVIAFRRRPPGLGDPDGRLVLAAGIAAALLVDPNLYAQDCLLVFLLAEVLAHDGHGAGLGTIVGVAALASLVMLDQVIEGLHLFPLALAVGLVTVAAAVLSRPDGRPDGLLARGRRLGRPAHPPSAAT